MDINNIINDNIKWPLFENAPVPICIVDTSGNFIEVNDKWCALTGYSKAELKKMTFQEITHVSDLHGDLLQMSNVISTKERAQSQLIKRYIRKDNTTIQINLIYNTILDQDNNVIGFISWALPIFKNNFNIFDQKFKIILFSIGVLTIIDLLLNLFILKS